MHVCVCECVYTCVCLRVHYFRLGSRKEFLYEKVAFEWKCGEGVSFEGEANINVTSRSIWISLQFKVDMS